MSKIVELRRIANKPAESANKSGESANKLEKSAKKLRRSANKLVPGENKMVENGKNAMGYEKFVNFNKQCIKSTYK